LAALRDVLDQIPGPGAPFRDISIAGDEATGILHVVATTQDGGIWHTMRRADADWPDWRERGHVLTSNRLALTLALLMAKAVRPTRLDIESDFAAERVERLRTYRWSSYRYYSGQEKRPEWLTTETVLGLMGQRGSVKRYQRETRRSSRARGTGD
jgi:hypothetical protein